MTGQNHMQTFHRKDWRTGWVGVESINLFSRLFHAVY